MNFEMFVIAFAAVTGAIFFGIPLGIILASGLSDAVWKTVPARARKRRGIKNNKRRIIIHD